MTHLRRILIIFLLACPLLAPAQEQATPAADSAVLRMFVSAPDSVFLFLSRTQRMDMTDYHRYGLPTAVRNRLGSDSRIVESGPMSLTLRMGDISTLQVALLPQRSDTLVAFVETVATPQPDSGIYFRRMSDWAEVPQQQAPSMADFVEGQDAEGVEFPPLFFRSIRYLEEEALFEFTNTTGSYYGPADRPAELELLRPALRARFDGRRWKIVR